MSDQIDHEYLPIYEEEMKGDVFSTKFTNVHELC